MSSCYCWTRVVPTYMNTNHDSRSRTGHEGVKIGLLYRSWIRFIDMWRMAPRWWVSRSVRRTFCSLILHYRTIIAVILEPAMIEHHWQFMVFQPIVIDDLTDGDRMCTITIGWSHDTVSSWLQSTVIDFFWQKKHNFFMWDWIKINFLYQNCRVLKILKLVVDNF